MNNFTIRKLCILNLIQIILFESFEVYLFTILNLRILNLIKIILVETFEVYLFTIRNLRMSEKSEIFQH